MSSRASARRAKTRTGGTCRTTTTSSWSKARSRYKTFRLGQFTFERNAYFCVIHYPGGEYHMPVGEFLRAVQRDIGWNFFYGMVKFDQVFGSFNFYDKGVDLFLGKYNDAWQKSG